MSHRRRSGRKGYSTRAFGSAVRSIVNKQSETKHVTVEDASDGIVTTAGTRLPLFLVGGGTGDHDRIGNRIRLTAIHVKVNIVHLLATGAPLPVRVLIFKRKDSFNVANPLVTLPALLDPDIGITKLDRFAYLNPQTINSPSQMVVRYSKRFSSGGQLVEYTGAGNTDVQTGMWYLLLQSVNDGATLRCQYRLDVFYKDV